MRSSKIKKKEPVSGRERSEGERQIEHLIQSEKAAALRRFISAVGHELNNPLTVIAGFAEILISSTGLSDQDRADLQMVVTETRRARQMVHDLLSLSREQPLQRQSVDLNEMIMNALDRYQDDFQSQVVSLITELTAEPLMVSADPDQIEQVLAQIITHWQKSLVTVEDRSLRVTTSVNQAGAGKRIAQIGFSYNGPELSPDELRQIFEPHYTAKEQDLGLGLALAYNTVAQHGGRMYALTPPDGGLSIIVELPA